MLARNKECSTRDTDMETVQIVMMGALLAMMGALLAMMGGLFLKMVDLGTRMGRLEVKVDTLSLFLREHTHDRDTGLPVAAMSSEAD